MIGDELDFSIDEHVRIEREYYIGRVDNENDEGGSVDIALIDYQNNVIFIENKIWSNDQKHQLKRYHKYGVNLKNFYLFYLNLFGSAPSKESIESKSKSKKLISGKDYWIISYREDIKNWLVEAHRLTVELPILRETILQYLNIIKLLTGQTRSNKMKNEILKHMQQKLESSFLIARNIEDLKASLINSLKKQFEQDPDLIKESFKVEMTHVMNVPYFTFNFKKTDWEKISINFEFQKAGYETLRFGIIGGTFKKDNLDSLGPIERDSIFNAVKDRGLRKSKTIWISYCNYPDYPNWGNNPEVWKKIQNGSLKEHMKSNVLDIAQRLDSLDESIKEHF